MVKPKPKTLLYILIAIAVVIQFFQPDRTNPPEDPQQTIEATAEVPPEIGTILNNACADCHSFRTRWPWYGYVAPVSWMLASDIREAREHINLSEWGRLSAEDRDHSLDEMCEEVEEGFMPLTTYRWTHPEARLSEQQVFAFCDWTGEERGRIRRAGEAGPAETESRGREHVHED